MKYGLLDGSTGRARGNRVLRRQACVIQGTYGGGSQVALLPAAKGKTQRGKAAP